MKFEKNNLVVVNKKEGKSKKDNILHFIKLADPTTFESEQFLLANESYKDFKQGDCVNCEIDVENGFVVATVFINK